jgi:O-antigen/teichoic acid export membrane protein/CelD/BcsL family acetyltransferase involved in cellulose biosynthesis
VNGATDMIGADVSRGAVVEPAGDPVRSFRGKLAARVSRFIKLATERGEGGAARRLAGGAFLMRVVNAGLGFATQILLARWMGAAEFGIYAYIWVWLLLIGGIGSLGLPVAALKFIPDYGLRGDLAGLRGFLRQARTLGVAPSLGAALIAGIVLVASFRLAGSPDDLAPYLPAALLALATLPVYVLMDIQTGIARAYDFADLGLVADYLVRPLLTLVFAAGLAFTGGPSTAGPVMAATFAAVALTAFAQGVVLQSRLHARIPAGPVRAEPRRWAAVSAPLLVVAGFTLLLGSTDILLLKAFVGPEEIARYFAATKIVAVATFVAYGVAATSSHRFAAQAVSGDSAATARLAAETVRWTFWPTLAVILVLTGLSKPLLGLFGPDYADAWPIVVILSLGLLAQAAVGPADRALAMQDQGGVTARIYAASFAANIALGLVLIPTFGLAGAALATALTLAAKSALLYVSAKRRLGLDMFVFTAGRAVATCLLDRGAICAELVTPAEAARDLPAWRDLAARALEPNVFYAPGFAPAGLEHLPEGRGARVLMAWQEMGGTRHLVGLLPVVRARGRFLNPLPIRRAALLYGTLSTPLLDPDCPDGALAAMLATLDRAGVPGLLLPFLHEGGSAAAALDRVAAAHGLAQVRLDGHARAILRSTLPGSEYVRATLETRRRKEADRQRRRLAEEGQLTFQVATAKGEIGPALDSFLALESAGWKGRLGTDLAGSSQSLAFIRDVASAMAGEDFRVATLALDGRIIAAGLVVIAGRRAFYIKTAYDEALARFSPGLLLTLDLTTYLLDDPEIDDADSIAVADHPMIDRIWTERFPVASVLVTTGPGRGALIRLAVQSEKLRGELRVRSSRIRTRIRAWRASSANDTDKNIPAEAEN